MIPIKDGSVILCSSNVWITDNNGRFESHIYLVNIDDMKFREVKIISGDVKNMIIISTYRTRLNIAFLSGRDLYISSIESTKGKLIIVKRITI